MPPLRGRLNKSQEHGDKETKTGRGRASTGKRKERSARGSVKEIKNKERSVLVQVSIGESEDSKQISKALAETLRKENRRRKAHGDSRFGYVIRILEG